MHRHAQVRGAVFLHRQTGIATVEQMQFDAIGERSAEDRRGGDPYPYPQRRVGAARVLGTRHAAHVVLAAGEEQRVGCYRRTVCKAHRRAVDLADRDTALDRRAESLGLGQQDGIEPASGNRDRGMGQSGLRAAIAGKDACARHALRIQRIGIDPEPRERLQRPPAQEPATDCITGLARPLDQQMRQTSARKPNRGRGSGEPPADDQRRRSTHNRNGKTRWTVACVMPASARIGGHSSGR